MVKTNHFSSSTYCLRRLPHSSVTSHVLSPAKKTGHVKEPSRTQMGRALSDLGISTNQLSDIVPPRPPHVTREHRPKDLLLLLRHHAALEIR